MWFYVFVQLTCMLKYISVQRKQQMPCKTVLSETTARDVTIREVCNLTNRSGIKHLVNEGIWKIVLKIKLLV